MPSTDACLARRVEAFVATRDNIVEGFKPIMAASALALLTATLGASWATQNVAHAFGYQRALDGRIVTINAKPIYQPFAILKWQKRWSKRYPKAFAIPKLVTALSFIGASGFMLLAIRPARPRRKPFGAKAWADRRDAEHMQLFADDGIVLGKFGRDYLCYDGDEHVLLCGGTRTGKTRGAVIPTLLAWPHSMIVLDIKNELYAGDKRHGFHGAAAYRSLHGPTLKLAFTQKESAAFNVLDTVRKGEFEVKDVQNIVEIIADPYGDGRFLEFWDRSAKQALSGLILHVLYSEEDKTIYRVCRLLANLDETAKLMEQTHHLRDPATGRTYPHPAAEHAAQSFRTYQDRTRSGIKATAQSYLTLFDDPLVQKHTSRSDFSIDDLMCADRPMTLFLSWPPSDTARLKPMIRLTLACILHGLTENQTEGPRGKPKRHRLLLLLDEFPQLGKLDIFQSMLGLSSGFDVRAFMISQSINFIEQAYGKDNTILDNCGIIAAYGATDIKSAKVISEMAGETREMVETETWSGPMGGMGFKTKSINFKEEPRALISPSEVRALPRDEQLIFAGGGKALRAKKIKYDQEPIFRRRLVRTFVPPSGLTISSDWTGLNGHGVVAPKESEPAPAKKRKRKNSKPTPNAAETLPSTSPSAAGSQQTSARAAETDDRAQTKEGSAGNSRGALNRQPAASQADLFPEQNTGPSTPDQSGAPERHKYRLTANDGAPAKPRRRSKGQS